MKFSSENPATCSDSLHCHLFCGQYQPASHMTGPPTVALFGFFSRVFGSVSVRVSVSVSVSVSVRRRSVRVWFSWAAEGHPLKIALNAPGSPANGAEAANFHTRLGRSPRSNANTLRRNKPRYHETRDLFIAGCRPLSYPTRVPVRACMRKSVRPSVQGRW